MSMNLLVFPVLWLSVSFDERNVYSTYRRETRDIDGTTLSRRLGCILTSDGIPKPNSTRAVSTWSNIIGGR